ncbi:MAG: branched-chain-amino-acid transaminase [Armatimonadetes bacterium]|nr:branched-chain-amino-acid transaminase [Armatimonadota bacterium]
MSSVVYIDGELVPAGEAKVSVYDHGLLYGDGVFEGIRAYNGRVFRLQEHLDRLYASARGIQLGIPLSMSEMESAVLRTIAANGLTDAYVRLVVTRGIGDLGLDPRKCGAPTVFIIASTIQLYPVEVYRAGLRLITCRTVRTPPSSLDPSVKSLNYLNNILAKLEVAQAGADEGIMLNQEGYVAECTADNLFLVRAGEVVTPSPEAGMLIGVTRNAVIEVARAAGYVLREALFRLGEVLTADECFLTGTGAEIAPVREVDGQAIGSGKPGPITNELHAAFQELTARDGTPIEAGSR